MFTSTGVLLYLYIFLQSNLLEVPVYAWFYRRQLSPLRSLLLVTLCNVCTHPIVFFGFMASHQSYLLSTLTAEAFAIMGETMMNRFFIPGLSITRALSAAFWANLVSWQLAPILTYWGYY